jgi:hypothetical protein
MPPLGYVHCLKTGGILGPTGFGVAPRNFVFGRFLLFLADFSIFSGFVN